MRPIILLCLMLGPGQIYSQNWQPFNQSETYCYISDTASAIDIGYRVDSIAVFGTDTFAYLNTIAQPLGDDLYLKHGPQFWQKAMRHAGDGLYYFSDPVSMVIQTQGHVGDSWMFNFDDATYATIIAADTLTILGELDSVKIIETTGGYTITLSKEHGLIRFPVTAGVTPVYCTLSGIRGRNIGAYFIGFKEYFDIHVGDVFEYHYNYYFDVWTNDGRVMQYTITSADVTDTLAVFSVEGQQLIYEGWPDVTTTLELIDTTIEIRPSDHSFTTKLPDAYEDMQLTFPYYWNLTESNHDLFQTWGTDSLGNKTTGDAYCIEDAYNAYFLWSEDETTAHLWTDYFGLSANYCVNYTEGLGLTHVINIGLESYGELLLSAYVKDGDTIGTLTPDSAFAVDIIDREIGDILVFPNPASNTIICNLPDVATTELQVMLVSMTGQTFTVPFSISGASMSVDIHEIPSGYYVLKCANGNSIFMSKPFCKSGSTP